MEEKKTESEKFSLKTYTSGRKLPNGELNYKTEFNDYQVDFIYIEFILENEKHEVEDWELEGEFKCFNGKSEMFSLPIKRKIQKFIKKIFIRDKYGHEIYGTYWEAGNYRLEVWRDQIKLGELEILVRKNEERDLKEANYKFRNLKTYASKEPYWFGARKYRQVFVKEQTDYIYAELSLYNKLLDQGNWDAEVQFKCFYENDQTYCFYSDIVVSENRIVVYNRAYRGDDRKGLFWKKGKYTWMAFVDYKKVASKDFYIISLPGLKENGSNIPVSLISAKLYEASKESLPIEERNYCDNFDSTSTRFVFVEVMFENNNPEKEWNCEVFFRFFNDLNEIKGQAIRLISVKLVDETIEVIAGWGSNNAGTWYGGSYHVDIVILDQLITTVPFYVNSASE